jgi:hypothetical protein
LVQVAIRSIQFPFEPAEGILRVRFRSIWPSSNYFVENTKHFKRLTRLILKGCGSQPLEHGVAIHFQQETATGADWSGYEFVSREGIGEWKGKHPRVLMIKM